MSDHHMSSRISIRVACLLICLVSGGAGMSQTMYGQGVCRKSTGVGARALGLTDTYLVKRVNPTVARGYNRSGSRMQDITRWDAADGDGDPAAGIISTAADLLTFGEALFGGRLVSQQSLDAMTAMFADPHCDDCGYGLGIETWKVGRFFGYGMNGSSLGVDANLIYFPEQQTTVVLFSNYGGGNRKEVIEGFVQLSVQD